MFVKKIAFAAILAASAYAQTETSSSPLPTSSLSPCLLTCASGATQCTFTDATCVCSNTDYQAAVLACLQQNCTADDIQEAQAVEDSLCGTSSSSASLPTDSISSVLSSASSSLSSRISSVSSRLSSLSSSRSSVTSSPTSTSTTGSSGAAGLSASLLATGGAVLLGVIGGGLLVF